MVGYAYPSLASTCGTSMVENKGVGLDNINVMLTRIETETIDD